MEPVLLSSLWLPIVVATVLVFIASSIAWTVLPHHRSDWSKLPDEEAARAALKGVAPGEYSLPNFAKPADTKSEAWQKKVQEGPVGFLTLTPAGPPKMAKSLTQWFICCLGISTFVGYIAAQAIETGGDYLEIFQIAGTAGFLAYSAAHFSGAIWFGHRWSRTLKAVADGLVYGLLTAGVFGWLWPS